MVSSIVPWVNPSCARCCAVRFSPLDSPSICKISCTSLLSDLLIFIGAPDSGYGGISMAALWLSSLCFWLPGQAGHRRRISPQQVQHQCEQEKQCLNQHNRRTRRSIDIKTDKGPTDGCRQGRADGNQHHLR